MYYFSFFVIVLPVMVNKDEYSSEGQALARPGFDSLIMK